MPPDFIFLLANGVQVIFGRKRGVSGALAIGMQCDRRAIASQFGRHNSPRRAPTRGAPTNCLLSAFCLEKGTHKGRPYRLFCLGVWAWEGHPQGVPLPIVWSRRLGLGRAPTRGAPTDCLVSAFGPGKGTHKGCPYRLFGLGVWDWEGHPQGVPLPIVWSRRLGLGRAPTRGAPTRFRQPHEVFSNLMQLP